MNFTNNLYHRCLLWVFELENPKGLHVTLAGTGVRLQGLCAGGMQRRGRDISAPAIGRMLLLLISYRLPFSSHLFLMLFLPESDSAAFRCVCECQVTSVMSDSVQPHGPHGPPGSSVHGILQARLGVHALLQGIFSSQGSNLYLLSLTHWQVDSLPPAPLGQGDN